jgi:hypothetical protein
MLLNFQYRAQSVQIYKYVWVIVSSEYCDIFLEYWNDGTVVLKELRKGVCAVTVPHSDGCGAGCRQAFVR